MAAEKKGKYGIAMQHAKVSLFYFLFFVLFQMVWHQLKEYVRRQVKPTTKEELIAGIQTFWSSILTPELCRKYIGHLKKVWPLVTEQEGGATGH